MGVSSSKFVSGFDSMTNLLHKMQTDRVPKQIVFGELTGTSPRHGTKKRWRDAIAGDLVSRDVSLGRWYMLGQDGSTSRDI